MTSPALQASRAMPAQPPGLACAEALPLLLLQEHRGASRSAPAARRSAPVRPPVGSRVHAGRLLAVSNIHTPEHNLPLWTPVPGAHANL